MKACSFLPAATKMIYDMGLQDLLYGVTFECPPESAGKPAVVRCLLEGNGAALTEPAKRLTETTEKTLWPKYTDERLCVRSNSYSSAEIDKIFSASKAQGKSLYYVEEALLQQIAPDIIFTQDVCEVCQIDTVCTANAVARLKKQPRLISLTPGNLEEAFKMAVTIAEALGREESAYRYLSSLQKRIERITDELRKYKAPPRKVTVMEWIEPIYNCGHWIPYQVAYAGGVDMLSNPGGDSIVTPWEKIVRYDPEVIVIAPCGFHIGRAKEELHLLRQKKEWDGLQAVKKNAVFLADYDLFTQPSPGTLTDGIELLAALFHPDIFPVPLALQAKYCSASQSSVAHVQA